MHEGGERGGVFLMCWHYARHWFFYVARWSASVRHTSNKNNNLLRYFPLGNIRIFVTKLFETDTFALVALVKVSLGSKRERNVGTVTLPYDEISTELREIREGSDS